MKKKLTALVICTLMVLCLLPATAMAAPGTWNGTDVDTAWYDDHIADPGYTAFTVSNGAELAGLRKLVNEGTTDFSGKTITLGADIDLGGNQWTPIGTYPTPNNPFSGTFDGAGHIISNLAIGTSVKPENTLYMVGLFGEAYNSTIKNLNFDKVSIYSSYPDAYVGALVGEGGTVENCSSSGNVTGGDSSAFVGGLVSYATNGIEDCHSSCKVVCGSGSYAGGLIAQTQGGSIIDSYATGDVTGSDYVGGLVGDFYGTASNCYATGNVICSGTYGGGFAGTIQYSSSGSVSGCYATGSVTASGGGGSCIGGFAGYTHSTISECFATGNVVSTGVGTAGTPVYVGGFTGLNDNNTTKCFASGSVSGAGFSLIGGLSGYNTASIDNCYASGSVTSGTGNNSDVGGLAGFSSGVVEDSYSCGTVSGTGTDTAVGGFLGSNALSATLSYCYFDTKDSGTTAGIGQNGNSQTVTGLTPDKMTGTDASYNMTGLDFSSVWLAKANSSNWYFPQLKAIRNSSNPNFQTRSQRSVSLMPFIVTFDTGEASETTVAYGYYTAVSEPTAPTRDGCIFDGWYTDSGFNTKYDFSTVVTSDITLHVKWTITITAESSNAAFGSVSGGGKYTPGTTVTLTGTPNTGYYFKGWYDGDTLVSPDATYKFTATQTIKLTARFGTYLNVTAASGNTSYGKVSGGGSFTPGTSVTLTSAPNKGYYFVGWYSGKTLVSASAVYTFSATTDVSLLAQFDKTGIPGTITASASAYNKITVKWSPVAGAKGYYIYRSTSADGTYKKVGTSKKTTYVNSGVSTGTTYYYKVAAYTKTYTGKFYSAVASAASALGKVTGVTAKSSNPTKAIIKWKAVPGAKKYQVLRCDTKDGTYTAIKTTSAKTITDTRLTPGSTYYYKVVAYKGTAYGPDSDIVSVKVKAAK